MMLRGNNIFYIVNEIFIMIRYVGMIGYDFWDNMVYDGLVDVIINVNIFIFYILVGGIYKCFVWYVFGRVFYVNKNVLG